MSVMTEDASAAGTQAATERVRRHSILDRLYHWSMAAAVFTLLYTAFWPTIVDKKTVVDGDPHWIAGVILTALIAIHIVRAIFFQHLSYMMIDGTDISNVSKVISKRTGRGGVPRKPGKYHGLQKIYHLGVAVVLLSVIGSGVLMLFKIGTPKTVSNFAENVLGYTGTIVKKDPYMFAQGNWDLIYGLHGLAAAAMAGMVLIHIYFAARPDEWHLTRSMFRGWISRDEYEHHHDAARWPEKKAKR
ncbi:MAG: cytochrome b/b6 domain-containing protein [Bauldia sp.]